MDRKFLAPTIIIVGLVSVNVYLFVSRNLVGDASASRPFGATQAFIAPPNQTDFMPILDANAGGVTLDAKAAIVYDLQADRNLFQKNIADKLPIASLTKVMTAVVTWENLDPNAVVTVQPDAVKVDGERQNLYAGEEITVRNLMQLMLVESANDAAYALRDYAKTKGLDLIALMNAKAKALNMINTHYEDPAGLDDTGYSTAADLVKVVHYTLRYDAIWNFSTEKTATVVSADGRFTHDIKSTNQLLGVLSDIVGGKTGYTDSALGCMILIVDIPNQNDKIISILLGSRSRFDDMTKLVDWARSAYRWE